MLKISIIIPVYNVEKYLKQCLDSIVNQTYQNIEIVLVDDGSPDNCPQICDEYEKADKRIKVIHKLNGGLSDARNKGVSVSTGDYGIFIDSDDYWQNENVIELLANRLSKSKADVLSFPYCVFHDNTEEKNIKFQNEQNMPLLLCTKDEQLNFLFSNNLYIASACNKIVNMGLLKKTPFRKGRMSEDIEWCGELLCVANSFDYINDCFYCYRQRAGSIVHSITNKNCNDLKDAIISCYRLFQNCDDEIKPYLGGYTAYQFSTFIAVQSFVKEYQISNIHELSNYTDILKYYFSSSKVKVMHYGTKIFGLNNWCKIIRASYKIWNSRRNLI